MVRNSPASTLFVLGLYSSGKEQLALAVAEARQCRIFCTDEERRQVERAFGAACHVTDMLHANGCWIVTLIRGRHAFAHMQTLQHIELTREQRERFTDDQSNAGVVIVKAPHTRGWDINELNVLKNAARCEHVLAIRPTGATPCSGCAAADALCRKESLRLFHKAV